MILKCGEFYLGQWVYVGEIGERCQVIGFNPEREDLVIIRYLHSFRDNPPIEKTVYKRIVVPITDLRELIDCINFAQNNT